MLNSEERRQAQALVELSVCNPFTRRRVELEQQTLGEAYVEAFPVWVVEQERQGSNPNVPALTRTAEALAAKAGAALRTGGGSAADRKLYEELAVYTLYYRVERDFFRRLSEPGGEHVAMPFYPRFAEQVQELLGGTGVEALPHNRPAHLFALFFQLRRAFHFTFRAILGTSAAASRLRADVWQAVFTHDERRFRQSLYARMHEMSTLILGPSGTGKELVASAIGRSRYIAFDEKTCRFVADFDDCFQPVHLAALPLTTLESELFGHRKGAFTGAIADRAGYLETRHHAESVFLDEIGELPAEVQVKLLRVLQTRQFQRLGDSAPRQFFGRILAATHRDLATEMQAGRFREDLYYRLCSDTIRTPTLREQLSEDEQELGRLVSQVAARVAGEDIAEDVGRQAEAWIRQHLHAHPWPGNMRELEQCVRSIVIRGRYSPVQHGASTSPVGAFCEDVAALRLDHDTLSRRYYALAYARTGSFEAAARLLNSDRRTVKARMDMDFLARLHSDQTSP